MNKPMAIIRLSRGEVGFYDPLTRIHLNISNPQAVITPGMNVKNIKRSIRSGRLTLVSGSLELETVTKDVPVQKQSEPKKAPAKKKQPAKEVLKEEQKAKEVPEVKEVKKEEPPKAAHKEEPKKEEVKRQAKKEEVKEEPEKEEAKEDLSKQTPVKKEAPKKQEVKKEDK